MNFKVSSAAKFLGRNNFICGIGLILFFLFSESIPFGNKISDTPPIFSVNLFLKLFPFLYDMAMLLLLIPSIIFLFIALLPLTIKKIKLVYFVLFLVGFLFFPILYIDINYFGFVWQDASFIWCILFLSFAGLSFLYKDKNFVYAAAITALFWDFGAAYIAHFWMNLSQIPTPYSPNLSPAAVMFIDMFFVVLLLILWWRKADFFKMKPLSLLP